MSTKIYNGYYISKMDLGTLYNFMQRFKSKINNASENLFIITVLKLATYSIDKMVFHGDPGVGIGNNSEKYSPIQQSIFHVWERQNRIEREKIRDPLFDFNCKVVFIPTESKIMCLLYAEREEYRSIWEAMPEVVSYPYWNNTDFPSDLTFEEWEERSQEWDQALGASGIPADAGFTIECGNKEIPLTKNVIDNYLHYIPSFEERVEMIADDIVIQEPDTTNNPDKSFSELVRITINQRKWLKTEEGQKYLSNIKTQVSSRLYPEISKHMLFSPGGQLIN